MRQQATNGRVPRSRKASRRRGAQVVEAALIATALFGITFLLLDVCMGIFLKSTFQHAVREGVRLGVTGYTTGGQCLDDAIKANVKQNGLGFLNSTAAAARIHVHFMSPVDGSVTDNASGNIIEVSVEDYQFQPLALFQRSGSPKIWARAYDVMEPYPGSRPCLTVSE